MAAVETAISRESSAPVAPPGLGRALILAGRLEQKSAEEIYRKAAGNRISFIAGLTGSGAVSAAVKGTQTGHLVMSTLHTNDTQTTLPRLRNMGNAPFNIAYSDHSDRRATSCAPLVPERQGPARGAQDDAAGRRLQARRTGRLLDQLPFGRLLGLQQWLPGAGRHPSGHTDHRRVAAQRIILRAGSALEIAAQAQAEGVRSLRQSGLHKVKMGPTSLEEVIAVTNE